MRSLRFALVLVGVLAAPLFARADRGAFSVEGGALLSAARVPPGIGTGDSVFGTLGGGILGVRYAPRNNLEVVASGLWFNEAPFHNDDTTYITANSVYSGQLQSRVSRIGATVGAHYVTGLVWRLRAGIEAGWSRLAFTSLKLVDFSDPQNPRISGPPLRDRTVDGILIAPVVGLEWMATDRLSFAIMPRIDVLLGEPQMTALSIPITVSWSWYGLFL
jgi:hypothetical protein